MWLLGIEVPEMHLELLTAEPSLESSTTTTFPLYPWISEKEYKQILG